MKKRGKKKNQEEVAKNRQGGDLQGPELLVLQGPELLALQDPEQLVLQGPELEVLQEILMEPIEIDPALLQDAERIPIPAVVSKH